MRRAGLPLIALLVAAPAVTAQAPTPVPAGQRVPTPGSGAPVVPVSATGAAPAAPAPALLAHLKAWEAVMNGTTNFYTKAEMTRRHLITNKVTTDDGVIMCLKPNYARMRMQEKPAPGQKADPNNYMAYICNGRAVYQYDGQTKQITEFVLPNGGVGDNLLLSFTAGALTANQILDRFDVTLAKEEPHYVHLEIRPRDARDKAEFESVLLVLFNRIVPSLAYLPRTVIVRKNNGQEEETWDFPEPRVNTPGIKPADFNPILPPDPALKDWKVQRAQMQPAPTPGQPRVARPQGTP